MPAASATRLPFSHHIQMFASYLSRDEQMDLKTSHSFHVTADLSRLRHVKICNFIGQFGIYAFMCVTTDSEMSVSMCASAQIQLHHNLREQGSLREGGREGGRKGGRKEGGKEGGLRYTHLKTELELLHRLVNPRDLLCCHTKYPHPLLAELLPQFLELFEVLLQTQVEQTFTP